MYCDFERHGQVATCKTCGFTLNTVTEDKIYRMCSVGPKTSTAGEAKLECKHRGESVGQIDCGCMGDLSVYKCGIFELCSIRKLKPGAPKVVLDNGGEFTGDIKYCNICDSRKEGP